jgi:hypothetical protein
MKYECYIKEQDKVVSGMDVNSMLRGPDVVVDGVLTTKAWL